MTHRHKPILDQVVCWNHCVAPEVEQHGEASHGGYTRRESCRCGAYREVESNGGAYVVGRWREAA